MFDIFSNLARAAVSVAAAPVLAVVDVVNLPADAHDGRGPFERSGEALAASCEHLKAVITPGAQK